MFFDRSWRRRDTSTTPQSTRLAVRMAATTALTRKTTTSPTAGTLSSESSAPSSSATSGHGISASSALSSSNGNGPRSPSTVVGIALAVAFAVALAVAFRLHYSWRRRAARRRNSTFIQYSFYTDAAPGRTSVVPRDELLTPPTRPAEWDARSTAASSTAATFNSPISASDPDPHHGRGHRPEVRSLDEKLRDIFYPSPTQAPYPSHPCFYPGPRASFAPSFSSPRAGSTPPISPPPPPPPPVMVQIQTQLPSFVPEPSASPRAWTGPRAPAPSLSPPYRDRSRPTFAASWSLKEGGTLGCGGAGEARGVGGRPPAYSRH